MSLPFRCSQASEERKELLVGSASTVRAFLLIEVPGPWSVDAVRDSRLPQHVKEHLAAEGHRNRVRPLIIRRHGRSDPDGITVFAGYADPHAPWLETSTVADPLDLVDIDLSRLGAGRRPPGMTPHPSPLFLVCTHGRHDACCAERGRPIAAALSEQFPDETWEISHIGGDRFAGNMLVLPEGLYYGRLTPESASDVARRHRAGHLALDHLRGRCGYPFAVQAAETYLREELGNTATDALTLTASRRVKDRTDAVFGVGDRVWRVSVRSITGAPEQLTCRATRPNPGMVHNLVAIAPG